ncbi:PAS domain S-box protein [Leptospira sp. 2 VSF19]|uniref:histidine kinase n=1 Tax=Leptospira soteropolitanensis TaxID=2950025 RepID=A0AAW5VH08_9LEPT|nr:PAS domain S-box protein [Leptospira soteropolitanensis]MCW7493518.1 PAS domain S-box protein [Leptospira soteropolitanensis]MCW7500950.1 PAS domain S-box protein [Leptospira soteropolitanensis]MCW7523370.1 PAS domain S-box protein [Leptospira soteropolitanensis]MCW7527231.1 PAS domain S-box protein [Leptospira soteropolitanensis]MCW7531088.1 PAS domain S-box protein [Leptospira soteropolitanensis]
MLQTNYIDLLSNVPDLICEIDDLEKISYANVYHKDRLGYEQDEILGHSVDDFFHPDDRHELRTKISKLQIPGSETKGIWRIAHKNGNFLTFECRGKLTTTSDGKKRIVVIARDITEDLGSEFKLHSKSNPKIQLTSNLHYQSFFELKMSQFEFSQLKFAFDEHAVITITNREGDITYANDRFCEISMYSRDELIGNNHRLLNSGFHSSEFFERMYNMIQNGFVWKGEIRNRAKDGSIYWVNATIVPLRSIDGNINRFVALHTLITRTIESEEKVKQLLREKELLLQEVHHRIKNNLFSVFSLLKMQASFSSDSHLKEQFDEAAGRLRSMMALYDRLYRSQNPNEIDLKEYIPNLVRQILSTYPKDIKFDFILDSSLIVKPDIANNLGIILNELICNSVKHSFLNKDVGQIRIKIEKEDQQIQFLYSDDGEPLPDSYSLENMNLGFGIKLMNLLVQQLKGNVKVIPGQSVQFNLSFPY